MATETIDSEEIPSDEDEAEQSVTDLVAQLGRELAALAFYESRLTARRHEPELRRAGRDAGAALGVVAALLTAFVLANTAALLGLSTFMAAWLAALALTVAWAAVGSLLALALWIRAKRVAKGEPGTVEEARDRAEEAVRATLEELSKAITKEIAVAAIPSADGIVDVGEDLIESADDIVDAVTDELPGGGVVNQVWDIFLAPGRLGIRVATTVLKRGGSGG